MTIVKLFNTLKAQGIELTEKDGQLNIKAPKGTLTAQLKAALKENKEELLAFLRDIQTSHECAPIQAHIRAKDDVNHPLSFSQKRLWLTDKLKGSSAEYNIPKVFKISGVLDLGLIKQVFESILTRHEVLRTVYVDVDGEAMQRIRPMSEITFDIQVEDVRALSAAEQEEAVRARVTADIEQAFDLAEDVMLRVGYIHTSDSSGVLLFNMHHIASDGWSMEVLNKEFFTLYEAYSQNQGNPLPELDLQYVDYAHWQRAHVTGEVLDKQLSYWAQQLADVPAVHSLPLSYPRGEVKGYEGGQVKGTLPGAVSQQLQRLAKQYQLTPFMLLHGALSLLLSRHSNSRDIVIGTPVANRLQEGLAPLIGFFVNTLVLRVDTGHDTLAEYLAHVKRVHLDAQANQDVPFEQLLDKLKVPRSTSHTPLIQIILNTNSSFGVMGADSANTTLAELNITPYETDVIPAKFDLDIDLNITQEGVELYWTYDVSLFSAQAIERLNDHLCRLLTALSAVNEEEVALHTLPILSEAEQHHLVHGLNNTKIDYPKDSCIHELFEQQAQATPDKVAVEFGSQQLTYGALNRKANQLAHYLVNTQGVTPDTLVGLCVERSIEMIVGMLGILKAGGAYVPLDPNYPQARLAHIISDSRVQVVLTQSHLKAVVTQVSIVMLDDLEHAQSTHIFSGYSTEDLQHCADTLNGNNLAYVIYTSGSTGQPKGVMLTHQNVVNYLTQVQRYPHDDVECSVMSTSLSFDATVTPIFGAWVRGISLKVLPENNNILTALSESIVTEKSAMFKLTPAHLQGLELSQQAQGKHVVIVGGEAFSYELARKAINMMPNSLFINEYGPTEATVGCSAEIFGQQALKDMEGAVDINIGRAIVNTQLLVLDDKQNLLPMGATGELYIGGEGLARGYLHQPALTAERFIYNPFYDATQANSSEHLYRTGDLVRYLDDGKLEFVGRTDEQVKLRGYRIELAEIEHHLSMLAEVDSACVLVTDVAGMPQLVAYIKGVNNQALSTAQLQDALRSNLPDYMVPEMYVPLEQWPLTPNGKIDKRALIELEKTQSKTVRRLAQTPSEQKLAAIWAELLDLSQEEVCTQTSFFELGGNSLLTMRMMARIKGAFNQMMNAEQLFEEPTIQSIANKLDCLAILQTTAEEHNDEDVIAEGTL